MSALNIPDGFILMPEGLTEYEAIMAQGTLLDMGWDATECFAARYAALIRYTRPRVEAALATAGAAAIAGQPQSCEPREKLQGRQVGAALKWEPQFDVCSPKQEELVRKFVAEIAGLKGEPGRRPDEVRLLEMAQALYEAEREECGP